MSILDNSVNKPTSPASNKDKTGTRKTSYWRTIFILGIIATIASGIGIAYLKDTYKLFIVGGLAGAFLAVIMFFRPQIGAYLIIITTFTNISDIFTERGLPSINQPLVAILLLVVIGNIFYAPERLVPLNRFSKIELMLIIYFFVVILSYTVATDKTRAFDTIISLLKNIVIFFTLFLTLNTKEKLKTAIYVLLATMIVLSTLGVVASLTNSDFTFWGLAKKSVVGQVTAGGDLRYGGPVGLPNVWGQILVVILPFFIYRTIGERNNPLLKLTLAGSILLILLTVFLTGSRGAFVALLFSAMLIAIDQKVKVSYIFAAMSVGVLFIILLPQNYSARFVNLLFGKDEQGNTITTDEAVVGRLASMEAGFAMAKDHPFLGVGTGNFKNNYWDYAEELGLEPGVTDIQSEEGERHAHSLYIEIISETGLFGLSTFLLFIVFLISEVYKVVIFHRNSPAPNSKMWRYWITPLLISLMTYLVSAIFLHGVLFRWLWVIAGIAVAAIYLSEPQFHKQSLAENA